MQRVVFPNKVLPYFLVAPQIILSVIFFFWPASQALYQSMQREDPFGLATAFVGFDNFVKIFKDLRFLPAVEHVGLYLAIWLVSLVVLVVVTELPVSLMRVPVGCEWIKSTLARP